MKLSERIERDKITVDLEYGDPPSTPLPWQDHNGRLIPTIDYEVTLFHGDESMTFDFHTGIGWDREPSVRDILDALLSDAAGIENAGCFSDWASEYGYGIDDDPASVRVIYDKCEESAENLRRVLGDKYDDYLWETEHDR